MNPRERSDHTNDSHNGFQPRTNGIHPENYSVLHPHGVLLHPNNGGQERTPEEEQSMAEKFLTSDTKPAHVFWRRLYNRYLTYDEVEGDRYIIRSSHAKTDDEPLSPFGTKPLSESELLLMIWRYREEISNEKNGLSEKDRRIRLNVIEGLETSFSIHQTKKLNAAEKKKEEEKPQFVTVDPRSHMVITYYTGFEDGQPVKIERGTYNNLDEAIADTQGLISLMNEDASTFTPQEYEAFSTHLNQTLLELYSLKNQGLKMLSLPQNGSSSHKTTIPEVSTRHSGNGVQKGTSGERNNEPGLFIPENPVKREPLEPEFTRLLTDSREEANIFWEIITESKAGIQFHTDGEHHRLTYVTRNGLLIDPFERSFPKEKLLAEFNRMKEAIFVSKLSEQEQKKRIQSLDITRASYETYLREKGGQVKSVAKETPSMHRDIKEQKKQVLPESSEKRKGFMNKLGAVLKEGAKKWYKNADFWSRSGRKDKDWWWGAGAAAGAATGAALNTLGPLGLPAKIAVNLAATQIATIGVQTYYELRKKQALAKLERQSEEKVQETYQKELKKRFNGGILSEESEKELRENARAELEQIRKKYYEQKQKIARERAAKVLSGISAGSTYFSITHAALHMSGVDMNLGALKDKLLEGSKKKHVSSVKFSSEHTPQPTVSPEQPQITQAPPAQMESPLGFPHAIQSVSPDHGMTSSEFPPVAEHGSPVPLHADVSGPLSAPEVPSVSESIDFSSATDILKHMPSSELHQYALFRSDTVDGILGIHGYLPGDIKARVAFFILNRDVLQPIHSAQHFPSNQEYIQIALKVKAGQLPWRALEGPLGNLPDHGTVTVPDLDVVNQITSNLGVQ